MLDRNQAQANPLGHRFRARTGLQLAENGRDMELHGVFTDMQCGRQFLYSPSPAPRRARPAIRAA